MPDFKPKTRTPHARCGTAYSLAALRTKALLLSA